MDDTNEKMDRFQNRIMRGFAAYSLWKSIQLSRNTNDYGKGGAEKNCTVMGRYGDIFLTMLFALETAFIIELYKFFDSRKDVLKLVKVQSLEADITNVKISDDDKKQIESAINTNRKTIEIIEKLRHTIFAHDKLNNKDVALRIPSIFDLDKLFAAVREIFNIISKNSSGSFYVFPDEDSKEMRYFFEELLSDLDIGKAESWKRQEEKWHIAPPVPEK